MNTRLTNEATSTLENDKVVTITSQTERLEAHYAELDKLSEMIHENITDEEFAAEFEVVMRYQDVATRTLGESKARQALLQLN